MSLEHRSKSYELSRGSLYKSYSQLSLVSIAELNSFWLSIGRQTQFLTSLFNKASILGEGV